MATVTDYLFGLSSITSKALSPSFLFYLFFLLCLVIGQYAVYCFISKAKIAGYINKIVAHPVFEAGLLAAIFLLIQVLIFPLMKPTELLQDSGQASSGVNYDYYTQYSLQHDSFPKTLFSLMKNLPAGKDMMRHPVSGFLYYLIWIFAKNCIIVKLFFSLFNLASSALLYSFVKKITSCTLMSFTCAFLFLITPMAYISSHHWTSSMSQDQVGIFFILVSLVAFTKYCETLKDRYFYCTLLSYILAFLSHELFLGFFIAYISIYLLRARLFPNVVAGNAPRERANPLVKLLITIISTALIFITFKIVAKEAILRAGCTAVEASTDLRLFFATWKRMMIGDTSLSYGARGILYYIMHFPFYFLTQHFSKVLYVFFVPYNVALFNTISLSALNILFLYYYRNQDEGCQSSFKISLSVLIGTILFIAAVATPLFAIGQIRDHYIYCGYFGLLIAYSAVFCKLRTIEHEEYAAGYHLVNIALLFMVNIFEFKNLSVALNPNI